MGGPVPGHGPAHLGGPQASAPAGVEVGSGCSVSPRSQAVTALSRKPGAHRTFPVAHLFTESQRGHQHKETQDTIWNVPLVGAGEQRTESQNNAT